MKLATFFLATTLMATPGLAVSQEPSFRVDPPLDCSTPILDADSPQMTRILLVQFGGDAIRRELSDTYKDRLAGIFWDQHEGEESRLILRLTGDEAVAQRRLTVCGEPLIIEFISGQTHTREELYAAHSQNLGWFVANFPGLQGSYSDERTGEVVLELFAPETEGANVETLRLMAERRLGVPVRTELVFDKAERRL